MDESNGIKGDYLIKIRNLKKDDFNDMKDLMLRIYSHLENLWTEENIKTLVSKFPEGQIGIEDNGRIVAFALSLIIKEDLVDGEHTFYEITGNDTFKTHDPDGEILYGIDVAVHPDYQGMRLGHRLYNARKEICEELNLKSIVAGGRMPNYYKYKDEIKPKEYIERVKLKKIYDPVLTFQLSNDFHVRKILPNYLPEDMDSRSYATLIEWNNIFYSRKRKIVGGSKDYVRIGLVQWQMRRVSSLESLMENVEFFVDALSGYRADFLCFPELFNIPLIAQFNQMDQASAVRELARFSDDIVNKFVQLAVEYNINIIAGSMPVIEDNRLFNMSYLCKRDGSYDKQPKLHITSMEKAEWGVEGGDYLKVFQTDVAKIGILVCYDAEFPELSRLLADQGMQILFVPFSTDTQNGYQRVRITSKARAVENECYVAIAGSVGNLPKVKNMDIQYAQSAVFSPSDFAFPQNAIIAEGTPNNEMTIIAEVDLNSLKELHEYGSVNNLKDRRNDLYELKYIKKA